MRYMFLLTLAASTVFAGNQEDPQKTARKKLQGTWTVSELTEAGKKAPKERREMQFEFASEKVKMTFKGQSLEGTYQVDSKKSPAHLDLTFKRGDKEFTIPAVYELDGNTLKLCHPFGQGGPRPEKLEATDKTVLAILKKRKD